ncbi:hypothetical protein [Shinella kummerowiae]|uniref:hypothetical protein n=1 Tax=Shinella kummerowiae TaxID=417745 RepID=UPI0021B6A4A8|nr:hypothetical protein [Shinella kummerowiae]MCT7662248.1 hypothetical protein [Shinella kummerowiae]
MGFAIVHQKRIIIGACWTVVAGLLLPAIFGGREDLWGRFIFEYQTLLAGILAVFAAAVAVSQSVATDANQERRHRQQLMASQRRDNLAAGRVSIHLMFVLMALRTLANAFSKEVIPRSASEGWSLDARTAYVELLRGISYTYDELERISPDDRLLFDPRMMVATANFSDELGEILVNFPDRAKGFPDLYLMSDHAPARFDESIRESCLALLPKTAEFMAEVQRWHNFMFNSDS